MVRRFLSLVFAFLLLGLQQELLLHPLTHLPELKARHHSSLKLPTIDVACIECSLLAGATHAAAGSPLPAACDAAAAECCIRADGALRRRSFVLPEPRTPSVPLDRFGAPRFVRGAGSYD